MLRLVMRLVNGTMLLVALVWVLYLAPGAFGLEGHLVSDESMAGSVPRGALLYAEPVPSSQLEVGDVISFVPPGVSGVGSQTTRRVVSIENGLLRTRADALSRPDPFRLAAVDATYSRMVMQVPYLGYAVQTLMQPGVRIALIVVPLSIFFTSIAIGVLGRVRRRNQRRAARRTVTPAGEPAGAAPSPDSRTTVCPGPSAV